MTTLYPSSLDTFTNPTPTSTLGTPPHNQQHDDINDAVTAIEAVLGTSPQGGSASVKARIAAVESAVGSGAVLEQMLQNFLIGLGVNPTTSYRGMAMLGGGAVGASSITTSGTRIGVGFASYNNAGSISGGINYDHLLSTGAVSGQYCGFFGPRPIAAKDFFFGGIICLDQSTANQTMFAGLAASLTDNFLGTSNNLIGVRVSATGTYQFVSDNGGVEATIDTAVTPANGVYHSFLMLKTAAAIICYWDGVIVGTIVTNIPTAQLTVQTGVATSTTAAKALRVSDLIFMTKQ